MSTLPLRTVRAVCPHDCPDTCGMTITVRDGRAVELRGDREHPFTRGFLCQKVAPYLERTYHPERLKWPMRRTGPKGAGQFERISWAEAIDTIARRFRGIAASVDGPQAILPYSYAGTMGKLQGSSLDRRFFHRLGASLLDRTICATAGAAGCDITLGTRAVVDPESVVHSRYIINWGSNTRVTNSHLWALMHQARQAGARLVTIDPYRTPTAQASDWWLAIRPGTDAALALGLMHVIWRDGLQDDDYLERYCLGAPQLRDRALSEYPPERVAAITGLPPADIERLAREYATIRPALIRLNYGLQRHGGGGMAVRTITCLPAIVGSWREVGGGALLSTSALYPFNSAQLERPDLIPPGTRTINMVQLGEALLGRLPPPPIRALFVYNANPAAVCPDQQRVLQGLRREDLFTVVLEQFPTDTTDYADIVLPATTQLEHFDIHGSYGHCYVQVNEPAIAPLYEAKPNTEVFRLLARAMGFEPELFEVSDEELARQALQAPAHGRAFPPARAFDGITLEQLRAEGPMRLRLPRPFLPFAQGGFPTPSGKCELYSPRLAAAGLDPLPNYTPPHEDPQTRPDLAARYPLQMLSPPAPSFLNSSFVNIPQLRRAAGRPTLEIHPIDAQSRGIVDGQRVRVFNDRGSFTARAKVAETVRPGVVVTLGIWWNKYTADGVNCNSTTSSRLTDLGGGATFFDNLVEVTAEPE
ncbi:MAG: molybdopterin oxidoreductase family protein [Gemmataceae bacterium]|nr:molybdopterin oxidoreductase family protein [Gemmataceae bacterium]MDW8264328.1 molybdopterin oxidoreductase family protein [Gemmataceae bacterium]